MPYQYKREPLTQEEATVPKPPKPRLSLTAVY